jgi:tetratricopeptide (TPR) repeat protein
MKHFIIYFLFPFLAYSQNQKGASPIANSQDQAAKNTYALVVGISDYQDPAIPDLRFADKDAEAFGSFLRSKAGGSLPESSINLLLNQNATTGKIIAALDGIISNAKRGDKAIIYFSGHGDVEKVTKFQRGYWLTWDSPAAVYAAGAFSLVFLQDIITTLSEGGIQVIVVSDACRAGKLAGSEFGGAQATSSALAKQFANEVKILSCQPDEFSLEGEQWGGGRGAFSFHLINALYGLADINEDGILNLREVGRYLEDRVPAETAPHSQIPFTVGSAASLIANVNPVELAEWRKKIDNNVFNFSKIDSKGLEELVLSKADTNVQKMYAHFNKAIEIGNLISSDSLSGKSAYDYYQQLIKEQSITHLHGLMKRNFAAALMDQGQQFINKLLKNDHEAIDVFYRRHVDFSNVIQKLELAAELLGKNHYTYNNLMAKSCFFHFLMTRKLSTSIESNEDILKIEKNWLNKGLKFQEDAPFLLMPLAMGNSLDSLEMFTQKLEATAPKWALWYYFVGSRFRYAGNIERTIQLWEKAISIDSTFWSPVNWIADIYENKGRIAEARQKREQVVRMVYRKSAVDSSSINPDEWTVLGNALINLNRFKEAERALDLADKTAGGEYYYTFPNRLIILSKQGKFAEYINLCRTKSFIKYPRLGMNAAVVYQYYLNDKSSSEEIYNGLASDSNATTSLGDELRYNIFMNHWKYGETLKALETLADVPELSSGLLYWKGEALQSLGKIKEAQAIYKSIVSNLKISYKKKSKFIS